MGQIKKIPPVKLFTGMLSTMPEVFEEAISLLCKKFGAISVKSPLWDFDFTDYYKEEMGSPLKRQFIAFDTLIAPHTLSEIKLYTNELESNLADRYRQVARPINLDPGYLDQSKVILATTKDYSHRIYINQGIFAEVTLVFRKKSFQPYDWTYPDYRTQQYINYFTELRMHYQQNIKEV